MIRRGKRGAGGPHVLVFFFDLLRGSEIPDGEPFEAEYSPTVRARFQTSREPNNVVHLRVEMFEEDELRMTEDIREKLYDPGMICGLLRRAGFVILQCSDRLLLDSPLQSSTWYIAAGKNRR